MRFSLIYGLLLIACCGLFAQDPPPLDGALWRGEVVINIKGDIFNQYIANETPSKRVIDVKDSEKGQKDSKPEKIYDASEHTKTTKEPEIDGEPFVLAGYVKSKGSMQVDATYTIAFQINDLGEAHFVLKEDFQASQEITDENHRKFNIERKVKRNRMRVQEEVNLAMRKTTKVNFEREQAYTNDVPFGNLEFIPSGRMNRKGSIQVKGSFNLMFNGRGQAVLIEEREPPSEDLHRRRTQSSLERSFVLPVSFTATVNHRKDAETGQVSVVVEPENPFSRKGKPPWLDLEREAQILEEKLSAMTPEERERYNEEKDYYVEKKEPPQVESEREIFTPRLNATGSFSVTPLFD